MLTTESAQLNCNHKQCSTSCIRAAIVIGNVSTALSMLLHLGMPTTFNVHVYTILVIYHASTDKLILWTPIDFAAAPGGVRTCISIRALMHHMDTGEAVVTNNKI